MRTGIYWQNRAYPGKGMDFVLDPSLALYLPLYRLDGASFMSKDAYGHLCTVTGALWRPDGRWFDGSDDKITLPDISSHFSDEATLIMWLKLTLDPPVDGGKSGLNYITTSDGGEHYPYTNGGLYISCFRNARIDNIANSFNKANWHQLAITTKPGTNNYKIFQNTQVAYEADGLDSIYISSTPTLCDDNATHFLWGSVGEVFIYNRSLTPLEIQQNYLATKWRYQ